MLIAMLLSQHLLLSSSTSISWYPLGHDVMGIPESYRLQFDLMRHIHRLMYEQVLI